MKYDFICLRTLASPGDKRPAASLSKLFLDAPLAVQKEFWGKGYADEAVTAVIDYCARELKLHRLCAQIDDRNERSKQLMTKVGFAWIATLPEADFGGRVADVAYYTRSLHG